jgi:hypothetical protein
MKLCECPVERLCPLHTAKRPAAQHPRLARIERREQGGWQREAHPSLTYLLLSLPPLTHPRRALGRDLCYASIAASALQFNSQMPREHETPSGAPLSLYTHAYLLCWFLSYLILFSSFVLFWKGFSVDVSWRRIIHIHPSRWSREQRRQKIEKDSSIIEYNNSFESQTDFVEVNPVDDLPSQLEECSAGWRLCAALT